jgi:DNA-binding LytR/AlgR family response regulator
MEHNVAKNPHLQINEKSKLTCPIAHIIRLEAVGNYCKIITKDQSYFIPKTLKRFALVLPSNFIRLHGKHLVNVNFISSYNDKLVYLTNHDVLQMSRRKKGGVVEYLKGNGTM